MILEVVDQGRLEKLAVVNGSMGRDIDGRAYIGGTASTPVDTNQSGSTSPSGTLRHCPSRTESSHIVSPGKLNEIEVEKTKSPMHIRFGSEEES